MLDVQLCKAQRSVLRDQVVEAIRGAIAAGSLAPGRRLVESEIAASMGVSKAPVREALRVLEAEGLITASPHKGSFVTRLTPEDVKDVCLVRSAVERVAVGLLVDRRQEVPLSELRATIDEMRRMERELQPGPLADADIHFHELVVLHCGSRRLALLWAGMQGLMRMLVSKSSLQGAKIGDAAGRHNLILEAIERGDRAAAQALIEEHVLDGARRIVKVLQSVQQVEADAPNLPGFPASLAH